MTETIMAIIETFAGTGLVLGPVIGSFLFEVMGFMWIYLMMGTICFAFAIPSCCVVKDHGEVQEGEKKVSVFRLFTESVTIT